MKSGSFFGKLNYNITDGTSRSDITSSIQKEKERLKALGIPGFKTGVTNWKGGLARINEQGGEIVNLPSGANVIPHDISMQIANAIGSQSNQPINISLNLDGKVIAQYQYKQQRSRARGMGVSTV
jgi:phage-related protein